MRDLNERLNALTPAQRALLDFRLQEKNLKPSSAPQLVAHAWGEGEPLALSFAQQRLWFLQQLSPESGLYNTFLGVRLKGALDVAALEKTFDEILRRHKVLCTVFAVEDGQVVARLSSSSGINLQFEDLRDLDAARREADALMRANEEVRRPFDLSRAPLLRALMLRLGEEDHIIVLTMHHIVSDRWSIDILMQELAALYDAYSKGNRPPLADPPVQYADFAVWQREYLQGERLEKQLSYWKRQLGGDLPTLELPADRPRTLLHTSRGERRSCELPGRLFESLTALSRREGTTDFMTLLAAFKVLLYRYTGQDDLVVGTPIANRAAAKVQGLIGCFVNTLVLRNDFSGDPSFRETLGRVRAVCLDAYAQQDVPFERLVEELQPERRLSNTPLFQVMFALNDRHDPVHGRRLLEQTLDMSGLSLTPIDLNSGTVQVDLILHVEKRADRSTCAIEYSTDLFDDATVERMLRHYLMLLEGIVADPDRRLSELPLMTPAERRQVLRDWNETTTDYQPHLCIHELFAAQAASTPAAVALVGDDGTEVSYDELNRRANGLAHYLRERGVVPETLVGVMMGRSADMIVAMLGILKAGGAYLPLDLSYPKQRLAHMLEDTRTPVLLTQQALLGRLPEHEAEVLCLDTEWDLIARQSADNPPSRVAANNLAYVIYTSGSTGRPKGVCVTHRAINRLVRNTNYVELKPADRVAQASNASFDAATFEVWGALLHGARLVMLSKETILTPQALVEQIAEREISVMFLTTALFNQLANAAPDCFRNVRQLMFGGEAVDARSVERVLSGGSPERLLHVYGPTESTTFTTWYLLRRDADRGASVIPIGLPISNTTTYLLDKNLQPVPAGLIGEIYIGGDGLARGYLNRAELTAEKFFPDPFGGEPGGRLYKTGDVARQLDDGNIVFLGRIDSQVKVRGFRIELGEIEEALALHPEVRETVVLAREDVPGERQLVAYVNAGATAAELRAALKERLPDYMVPAVYVMLDEFPLTPNGKIDRKNLPAPDFGGMDAGESYVAPRTPVEEVLAGIWAELLRAERVSVEANFFELGGHSLLATQMAARVEESFQVQLPLRTLFEAPTIADLSVEIRRLMGKGDELEGARARLLLPQIEPAPEHRHLPFPLTEVQQAYWIGRTDAFELGNVSAHGYLELDVHGLDTARLEEALERLIERHDMLRAVFLPDGRQQVLERTPPFRLPVEDWRGLTHDEREAALLAVRDVMSHQVLPSDRWPLFEIRAGLLGDDVVRLFISTDALIGDAWSWQILSREIALYYQNPGVELEPLTGTFRDYVMAEIALRETPVFERALGYWRGRLATFPPAPDLPLASRPVAIPQMRFERRTDRLEAKLWRQLKAKGTRRGLTPSGLVLAVFAEVLALWSKNKNFTVNLTLFNRLPVHPQVNQIVGDFTSLILLAVNHQPDASFERRALLLQAQLFDDLDHRYVSGVRVIRELASEGGGAARATMPVVFTSLLNLDTSRAEASPISGQLAYSISQTPQVWLDHQVYERGGDLVFTWDAVEDLFPAGLLDDVFRAFSILLRQLAETDEGWGASRFDLLPPAQLERRAEVNDTAAPLPRKMLHMLFDEQVGRRGAHAAVISAGRTVSYDELYLRSNLIARRLREAGARPNRLVAVVMEKGWEQVAAVLAVLYAGAAYLPVDPELPSERVRYLLDNGEVELVLTQPWIDGRFEWPERVQRIRVGEEEIEGAEPQPLEPLQEPTDLAYVIYTSGSTGAPKGVMIDHLGAVNTIVDINSRFQIAPADRVLALSKLSFDLSVYDIFGALAAGATVVMPDAATPPDPAHWASLLQEHGVTVWNSVPALMVMLADHLREQGERLPASLRLILMSGDWIPVTLPAHIRELTGEEVQIISLGGATEGSIWSILYHIGEVSPEWRSIPYGYPMVNQHIYVFDQELMPTPVWVTGEIYIGGAGVAKGYWRDEEKTAAKFMTHGQTGERLYRTGDLGRYVPDGTIEFLGREDFQVKIQGYRVELGEIEAALGHHPQVRENIVVARADAHGNKSLVAYLVAEGDDAPTPGELRNYLTDYLPEYMLPSAYVMLDALPLTPNGKIDRNALPEPDQLRPELDSAYLAPRTATEQLLESIWADVLGLARIGVHDDFFVLGGHSMMAARVLTQVREAFRIELSLRSLFESPTIAQMARLVDAALGESGGLTEPPLAPVERDKPLPLSFAQQRLWFLENLLHGSTAYSMPFAVRLHGELDAEALESSIGEIVNRHEALRTTFLSVDGKPAQVINPPRRISIPVVALENLDAALREKEALRVGREEASRPFDLGEGPLMRALLLRLSPLEHVLFLTMHHIVSDGWSLGIFLRELGILYQGFHAGETPSLPALPIQYADFAVWQREWLQGEVFERQLAYWRERLAGAPPVLQLPGSRPRPVIQTFRGGQHPLSLSPALTAALKELSRRERATLFMLLLAAFKLVLHRCSGEVEIVVGTPVANRNRRELEPLIGFFANTLVLRTDLSGNPSFADLLKRVRETALSAYAHQDVPFERLVEDLQPERALSHTPLFQVMLVLQNTPMDTLQLPGLTLQQVDFESGTVHFDLTLRLWEDGESLGGRLEYSADLYDEESAARLAGLFHNLLESVVAAPETRVSELQLLTETERLQILSDWNPPALAAPPAAQLVQHYFEAQARRNPRAVAVSSEGAQLTYAELDGRANGLAHRLRASGVGAETRVAICMRRSADYVVGVLGILKAGGAWVPLDPGYPAERIAFTIEDAKASILLTHSELLDKLDSHRGKTICLDTEWPEIERRPDAPPPVAATHPGNLAYIIYTSGSTGQPKGVMITHGNLCHYVEAMRGALGLTEDDVYLHTASFGFSSSVRQLLVPLARGARVLIAGAEEIGKPVDLFKLVRRERVTLMDVVPSYWRTCINELSAVGAGAREELLLGNDLRLVLSASESLPAELPRAWSVELGHEADFVNMLGHTETTGIVATHAVAPEADANSPIVPVGRPIDGMRIYLLDSYLNPVPAGMPGEIHVGGQGIGRGYLDHPELTAERFIPDPFAAAPGARMFRTGDIGRHRPDGTLEYLERKDHQVKIRGFRVELGEMEALLRTHPSVREAAVIARPDAAGFLGLTAFIVARDGLKQTPAELRGFLHSKVPGYMIPHGFVVLEQLPLTATGKIDRRALAALEPPARGAGEDEIAPPRNPVEEVLAGIWSDVLRVARVGVYDNFFALGGHSLIATQVISRIRDAFGVELPLRAIFESPTVAALGEAVEVARRSAQGLQAPPITPVARDGGNLPLSFAQQRLWFMHLFEPESPAYTIPTIVRMSGELDAPALKRSFEELGLRHEILRTNFISPGGLPVQVVAAPRPFDLPLTDLTNLSDAEQEAEIRRRAEHEMRQPSDLAQGSLMRAMLLRLGAQDHVLLLFMHHIISDGWSVGIFFKEMAALYEAFSTGRPPALAALPIQYADFAHWQQNWLRGEVLERHLAYWRDQLADVPAALDLPTDHPRPAVQTFRGATRTLTLAKELTGALGALCRRENVTEFMLLLAAFQTLLYRYTGQTDICVGTPIAGRNRSETEELIGFFVNTLVIRGDLAGDPTFDDFLQHVREHTLGAYEHQELPFEHLVEALKPQRMLNQNPIFQVLFVFQNAPASSIELTNLRLRRIELDSGTAKFDLTLGIGETPDGLSVTFEYSTDLFEAETIERMLEHYERLLSAVVRAPDTRVSRLPLLGERERQLLLRDFNDTATHHPRQTSAALHGLFAAQAARTPDRVAVIDAHERLSYAELERLSEAMAGELRRRGVRAESIVGVMLGRGARMVAAVLGVLKAGGAYLPLDAQYPAERLALMLGDSGARVLVTEERLLERVPEGHTAEVMLAEEVWARHEQAQHAPGARGAEGGVSEGEEGAGSEVRAGNAAYVIYTSGSTGRPKGVVIEHRSAVEMAEWSAEVYGAEELRGVLAATSLSFDLSVYEMFAPLSRGGAVVVVESALEMGELAEEVTLINTVPSVMSELLRLGGVPPGVRTVNLAGEALPRNLVREIYERCNAARVWNLYGPTEDTTYSTFALITRDGDGAPSIGRPISNTQAYILDPALQPVPLGVAGELYLGGAGLARGYLNRPDLTAERFIPDPFGLQAGGRLYRTGDLARYLASGELEYLGRADQQVKVRGFRIELGEIEAALGGHESIDAATVVVREDTPGDKRLVAYLVSGQHRAFGSGELRAFLKERLPDYMIPAAFVALDALPLTPNGKIDRRALPAPVEARPGSDDGYLMPRTPVEEMLASIWADVLKLERVGVEDNFFALGGHSLLATQVVSRVRTMFKTELSLRAFMERPTVAGLTEAVEASLDELQQTSPPPPLVPVSRDGGGDLPLSFAQQRLWFLDQLQPGNTLYNMHAALKLKGALDVPAFARAFDEIVRRHESLRTTFVAVDDGNPVQRVHPPTPLGLPLVDLTATAEAERDGEAARLAAAEARQPFDLGRGPLLRVKMLRLADDAHVVLVTMHHIISDGWSMGVMIRELAALYRAFSQGAPSPLTELPIQYADFAHWQREWLRGEVLERQIAYWRERLAGAPPLLELPTDRPRPALATYRGAHEFFALDAEASRKLKELGRQQGATLFMTMLAAFHVLLWRWSGQTDICVGTPIANRTRQEEEGLIGFFVNTLVMRGRVSREATFRQMLEEVREGALGAYMHQELPFEKLVEELQPERSLSYSPLFQVMLVLQNAPQEKLSLPNLSLSGVESQASLAKFDLTLNLRETGGIDSGGIGGAFEYNADLFDAPTIRRMAGHFGTLLEGILADPERKLSALPLLDEAERRQLLEGWNDTARDYPGQKMCLHEWFEAQAARTPDRVAVVFEGERLSYGELNRRANQLAHHLRSTGVGADSRVGICAERSIEMIVALLGTLKAGGAYVPLDPAYPQPRLSFMLEDSGVAVLLTQQHLAELLPASDARVRIRLDADWPVIARQDGNDPARVARPDNLAYVIYTSGSTGRPKGVMISHRAICNHMQWMLSAFEFVEDDLFLQKTPFSFDASVWEFYAPLLVGARLIVARPGGHQDPAYLLATIKEHSVTVLQAVPTLLKMLLETGDGLKECRSLRRVFCGGEALPVDLRDEFFSGSEAALYNLYGPTEATIDATSWQCAAVETTVPIGRPIANMRAYVLDEEQRLVPQGAAGELYLGGAGLARGYLNRPDLTAERFIPDPFGLQAGGRLYRTGDLARYLASGELEYLGRADQQVKVRGFRIELGEIEAALGEHPDVREAVVLARAEQGGERRLQAYVVAREGRPPSVAALGAHAKERLPDYMLPALYTTLDELPLLPNGKVDRRALESAAGDRFERPQMFIAPRETLELELAQIWEEVLGVRPVGVRDNFFEIGGHSLLAVRLVAQIQQRLGYDLPLAALFKAQTVEEIAMLLRRGGRPETGALLLRSPLVAIQPRGERPPFFCVHPIGGNVLCYSSLARHLGSEQPFYGLQTPGLDGVTEPHTTVEGLAAAYVEALREVQPAGPYHLGGWSMGGLVAFEMAQQLRGRGQEVASLTLLDAQLPADAAKRAAQADVDDGRLFMRFVRDFEQVLGVALAPDEQSLPQGEAEEQVRYILQQAARNNCVPPDTGLSQMLALHRVFKANMRAMLSYAPQVYAGGRVTLVRPLERPRDGQEKLWRKLAAGGLELRETPGTHYTMMREPHVSRLAEHLRESLRQT